LFEIYILQQLIVKPQMDFFTVTLSLGICVVTAGVLFLISIFSFKERTFEEALAEQQKFSSGLLKADKVVKEKETKKTTKKSVKKSKDKTHAGPVSTAATVVNPPAPAEEKPRVEFEPDPEIIPESEPAAAAAAAPAAVDNLKKKGDKKEKVKPILRHRDGHSPAPTADAAASAAVESPASDASEPANHFEDSHPKDNVELKHSKETGKSGKAKAGKSVETPTEVAVVEPVVVKEVAFTVGEKTAAAPAVTAASAANASVTASHPQQHQPSTPKKQQRKKGAGAKSDSLDNVDGADELLLLLGGTEKLLSAVRSVPLSAVELQAMIEVLLNRQQEAAGTVESEWMERGGRLDPLGSLKKQLTDKEKALKEEQEVAQAYQIKLKTLGAEIATERTRSAQARKQLEDSLAVQTSEVHLLTVKLQQAAEQHAAEAAAMRNSVLHMQKTVQMSDENLRQLQRVQEEKAQFGARVQQLEDLVRMKDQQIEEVRITEQQRREQEAEMQNQVAILAGQLQVANHAKSLMMDNSQALEAQREICQLRDALNASESQTLLISHENRERFEEMERTKQLLEDRITTVERDLQVERNILAQRESDSGQEVARLREENQALQGRISSAEQELTSERNSVAQSQNDSVAEIGRLREENQSLQDRIAAVSQELQTAATQQDEATSVEVNRLLEENKSLQGRIADAEQALAAERSAVAQNHSDSGAELSRLQEENQALQGRIADAEQSLASEKNAVAQNHSDSGAELSRLQEENQALQGRIAAIEQELATEKSAIAQMTDSAAELGRLQEENQALQGRIADAEQALAAEKNAVAQNQSDSGVELSRLQGENQALQGRIAAVEQELANEKSAVAQNQGESGAELGRLREENLSLTEQLSVSQQDRVSATESAVQEKQAELEAQQQKNNELREKNYKIMEALSAAEKALVESKNSAASAASRFDLQRDFAAVLQRVFPDIACDSASESFADQVVSQLTSAVAALSEAEQSKALGQVVHYKTVLAQTEELLNRLQRRVEEEERLWKGKTVQLEADMSAVRQERDFWMEQCQKQQTEAKQDVQSSSSAPADIVTDTGSLQTRIDSLEKEKSDILQEIEKERLAAAEKQQLLAAAEESLAQEKQTVQTLRQQLDQTKATNGTSSKLEKVSTNGNGIGDESHGEDNSQNAEAASPSVN